jgi:23S rRNA pseudouridine2605 synthase
MPEERVQKILSRAGFGSRRACEQLILASRVRINGQNAILGSKADPATDSIQVDGQRIPHQPAPVYVMLNKPQGVISDVETHDDSRQTVRDMIPLPGHLFSVGRLDYESEGLILLTNDGELANRLTHPRYGHEKEYRVLVASKPDERQLEAWRHGVVLEDGYRTAPANVREESGGQGKGLWLKVILREGKKRQIREMGKQTGMLVLRIMRIRMGSLHLGNLKVGDWRYLTPEEVKLLKRK